MLKVIESKYEQTIQNKADYENKFNSYGEDEEQLKQGFKKALK